jgi:hypothetical protein
LIFGVRCGIIDRERGVGVYDVVLLRQSCLSAGRATEDVSFSSFTVFSKKKLTKEEEVAKHVNIEVHGLGIGSFIRTTDDPGLYFRLFPDYDMTVTYYPEVTFRRDGSLVPSVRVTCDDLGKVIDVETELRKTWPEIIIIDPHIRS